MNANQHAVIHDFQFCEELRKSNEQQRNKHQQAIDGRKGKKEKNVRIRRCQLAEHAYLDIAAQLLHEGSLRWPHL